MIKSNIIALFFLTPALLSQLIMGPSAYKSNLPLLILGSLIFFYKKTATPSVSRWLVYAFAIRLLIAFVEEYYGVLSLPGKNANAVEFLYLAENIYEQPFWESFFYVGVKDNLWPHMIAFIYHLFGMSSLLVLWLNALIGTFIVYNTWLLAREIWPNPLAATFALRVTALFPYLWALSGVELRDNAIILFMILSIRYFVNYLITSRVWPFILANLLLLLGGTLHSGILIINFFYVSYFVYREVCSLLSGSFSGFKRIMMGIIVISYVFLLSFNLELGRSKLYFIYEAVEQGESNIVLDRLGSSNELLSTNAYRSARNYNSLLSIFLDIPIVVAPFFLTPLPWQFGHKLAYFNGIFYVFAFYLMITRFKQLRTNHNALILTIISSIMILTFAFGSTDYAAANRHKCKVVPILIVVISGLAPRLFYRYTTYEGKYVTL